MKKLILLFAKDSIQYQIFTSKSQTDYGHILKTEDHAPDFMENQLKQLLNQEYAEIQVISAMNHFTLMPDGFSQHELGYDLIAYNAAVDKDQEELMLSVNKKFGVQFYYTFPKNWYNTLKSKNIPLRFNFSGEKFLNSLPAKSNREIHINLYHHQCEFFALDQKKVILYNNLDVNSEVDFLYFIMFTLSKIGFGIADTHFYVYGETTENDTFISELRKFVSHLKIVYDNTEKKNFMLNQ